MRLVYVTLLALFASGAVSAAPSPAQACFESCFDSESETGAKGGFSGASSAIAVARGYMGTNPTGHGRLWCAHFMNMVERRLGRPGTGSGMARSFTSYGRRVANPRAGDIAVLARKGGGHVGYVMSVSGSKVKIISGNHGRKVGIGNYPRSRVIAFVRP